jgi:hypothetical protein
MNAQLLTVALIVAAPIGPRKADEPVNPYQNAKVGDFATYKMTMKVAGTNVEGSMTQTVTAKDDKTVTVETTNKFGGTDVPAQKQVIDLTKPLDPASLGNVPPGAGVTATKLGDGKEKLKIGEREFETRWESYKVKMNAAGNAIDSEMKVWQAKGLAIPFVRMEMSADVGGMKMEMTMELTETGGNSPGKTDSKK